MTKQIFFPTNFFFRLFAFVGKLVGSLTVYSIFLFIAMLRTPREATQQRQSNAIYAHGTEKVWKSIYCLGSGT